MSKKSSLKGNKNISVPLSLDPTLFGAIEHLCNTSIAYGANHYQIRQAVLRVVYSMQPAAHSKLGHDSLEIDVLKRLLKRTDPAQAIPGAGQPPPRTDPLMALQMRGAFTVDQISAANMIRDIWSYFRRFTGFSASNYEKEQIDRGPRSKAFEPADIIPDDIDEIYKDHYTPWDLAARNRKVAYGKINNTLGWITAPIVVFDILLDGAHPQEVDQFRFGGKQPGISMRVLDQELNLFLNPNFYGGEAPLYTDKPKKRDGRVKVPKKVVMPEEGACA